MCPWRWAGYSFRWGVLVLFGENTCRDFLRPSQKIGPVNIGLPEKRKREKGMAGRWDLHNATWTSGVSWESGTRVEAGRGVRLAREAKMH